jgi:hypothetical protein
MNMLLNLDFSKQPQVLQLRKLAYMVYNFLYLLTLPFTFIYRHSLTSYFFKDTFLTYFPYFENEKGVGLRYHVAVCVCVCPYRCQATNHFLLPKMLSLL